MTNQSEGPSELDRAKNGKFQKGHKKRGGRKAGTRNVITRTFKDVFIKVLEEHGRDGSELGGLVGYFRYLAAEHPRAYIRLLEKQLRDEARAQGKRRHLSDFQPDSRPHEGEESAEGPAKFAEVLMEIIATEEARASSAAAEVKS